MISKSKRDIASTPASRRASRLERGYSLEELAIATGLTIAEIAATEEPGNTPDEQHVKRIEHALR